MKLTAFLTLTLLSLNGHAQVAEKKVLSLDSANKIIAAAFAEAKKLNAPGGAIAVVDDGGNLVALERLDNTFAAGANISIGKARTAALFKKSTKVFEDSINQGRTTMVTVAGDIQGFTPLQGGIPIMVDGETIGGIGVSGAASAAQDEDSRSPQQMRSRRRPWTPRPSRISAATKLRPVSQLTRPCSRPIVTR